MSWLKKFFQQWITDPAEEDADNEMVRQHNQSPHLHTRMTFQYPKRNFRFPLIEDPPKKQLPNNQKNTEQNSRKTSSNERTRKRGQHQSLVRESGTRGEQLKVRTNNYERKEEVSRGARRKKIEPQSRQPFRPTEIPSPIYGFQRPEIDVTEYELKESFLRDETIITNVSKENDSTSPDAVKIELAPLAIELEELTENPSFRANDTEESRETFQSVVKPPHFGAMAVEEEPEEHLLIETPNVKAEENPLFGTGANSETNLLLKANDKKEADTPFLEAEAEKEPSFTESKAANEKATEDPQLSEVRATKVELEDMPQIAKKPNEERSGKAERTRGPLPFNVLMLKPDRKRLVEPRQRSERDSVSAQEQPVVEQTSEGLLQVATKPRAEEIEEKTIQQEEMRVSQEQIATSIEIDHPKSNTYHFPNLQLLSPPVVRKENSEWLEQQTALLNETLANFNVNAHVVQVSQGPAVTRFEVQPDPGVKVNKITNLSDDIKLSMAAKDIRIEAPIPGKRSIGIEIPNHESRPVQISEIISNSVFVNQDSPLTAVLGLDISGAPVVTDLRKMPHGLIAGATGSGKSVCINSILISLLYKARPDELKLLLIDPKMVELAPYNKIPHLVSPVISDVKAATAALKWAVDEMERRYELFAHAGVRDISRYNKRAEAAHQYNHKLPYIVVVIDELADLMMMAPADVEESICRIAQKARACGIHLLIATQRPSVDVITGLIKANVPTRIAFSVSSQIDSRTIIDLSGAEKLLGRGDMLFLGSGSSKPVRLQGTFVSDEEIDQVIHHVRSQGQPEYLFEQEELLKKSQLHEEEDELFLDACEFVVEQGGASTSLLQRQFRIGYNRAARLIDTLHEHGIISEAKGSKPRDILISAAELKDLKQTYEPF